MSKVSTAELIWTKIIVPKYKFSLWLATQDGLLTKDWISEVSLICDDTNCYRCERYHFKNVEGRKSWILWWYILP